MLFRGAKWNVFSVHCCHESTSLLQETGYEYNAFLKNDKYTEECSQEGKIAEAQSVIKLNAAAAAEFLINSRRLSMPMMFLFFNNM